MRAGGAKNKHSLGPKSLGIVELGVVSLNRLGLLQLSESAVALSILYIKVGGGGGGFV